MGTVLLWLHLHNHPKLTHLCSSAEGLPAGAHFSPLYWAGTGVSAAEQIRDQLGLVLIEVSSLSGLCGSISTGAAAGRESFLSQEPAPGSGQRLLQCSPREVALRALGVTVLWLC